MRVAPASSEFSRSSLGTEAGRSTTSPAAILLATCSERRWIRAIRTVNHKGEGETLFSEISTEGGIAGIARHRRHRRHRKNSPQKGDVASWCFLRLESPRPCCDEARQCASR